MLTGDQHPFHTVVNEFRLRHLGALPQLFVQVLTLCDRAGLLKLEHVSLDGSKTKANASKHKAMSHGRMEPEVERLEEEIQELLTKANDVDHEEDGLFGKDEDAHPIDEELKRRKRRLEIIRKAKAELEEVARQAKAEDLRERAERQREAATTETAPTERKRKLTRASMPISPSAATNTIRIRERKRGPGTTRTRRGRRCGQSWRRSKARSCTPAER